MFALSIYSMFHWIPPVPFHYPEIVKATEVTALKLKTHCSIRYPAQLYSILELFEHAFIGYFSYCSRSTLKPAWWLKGPLISYTCSGCHKIESRLKVQCLFRAAIIFMSFLQLSSV